MFESGRRTRSLDRITPGSSSGSSGYQTRSKTNGSSPFLSQNCFDALGDDDAGDGAQVEPEKKQPRVRIPPIHIMGKSVGEVVKLLATNGVPQSDDYWLKYTKTSVQFQTKAGDTLKASPEEKANLLADNFARAHRNPSPGDPTTSSAVEASVQQIADSTFPVESVPVIRPK
ncbi:hypothetical protein pipiens_015600, partial [Culex pipiens pipiens]